MSEKDTTEVKHQGDITEVEYPPDMNNMPRDSGEVFDMVVRKGPISLKGLMDQIHSMSQDAVFTRLSALRDNGYVDSADGDIEVHGTTRRVWYVPTDE